jgi:integrase
MTFERAAQLVHEKLLPSWRNKKHAETWIGSIELHANPKIGRKAIDTLGRDDVLKVLSPIWSEKVETAKRLRQRLATIFDWATGEGHYTRPNPVRGLKLALPRVAAPDVHLAAMPWRELPDFWSQLCEREAMSALCLRFAILTAARSGEARGARWSEIDLAGAVWTVPGERMKRGKPHRVPLSPAAIEILEQVRGMDETFCFPSPQRAKSVGGKAMSDMAFKLLYQRMAVTGFTSHGFRSAFRDWCSESAKADPELAEAALSHATGSAVTRAYARSDLFDRRRDLMEAWSRFVNGKAAGQVVQMVRA